MSAKKHFFLKLLPPRPDFAMTMTDAERAIMQQHAAHWRAALSAGKVHAFGPVMEAGITYGIGIASAESEDEIDEFQKQDPAIRAGVGFRIERFPMPQLVTR